MSKKTLLIIAAVAVMLVGATSAYGYEEAWDGWFNSGWLTLLTGERFEYVEGEGVLRDTTAGSVDSFLVPIISPSTFTCTVEGWTIKLWPGASGSKPTGQSGQKEVDDGATWLGKARLIIPQPPPDPPQIEEFDVWGTWESTPLYHFNYDTRPYSYTAGWDVSGSDPPGIEGEGGSSGTLQE